MVSLYKWALGAIVAVLLWQWWKTPHSNFPPVRRGIPVLGILPFIGNNINEVIAEWSVQDRNPVLAVKLGNKYTVYLNTYEAFYETFVKLGTTVAGRPKIKLFYQVLGGSGINTRTYSEFFKDQKLIILEEVKKFVNKNNGMVIREQGRYLTEHLAAHTGKPIDLQADVFKVAANITSALVFGKGFSKDNETFNNFLVKPLQKELGSSTSEMKKLLLVGLFYDYLSKIPPFNAVNEEYKKNQKILLNSVMMLIDEHNSSFDKTYIRHLTDSLIFHQKYGKWKNDPSNSNRHIAVSIKGLYTASTVTNKNMVLWNILALMHFPKYQSLIAKEIDAVIGTNLPSYDHLESMPTTSAFLMEVWRYCPTAANTPAHITLEDVNLMGYHLPKDTEVTGNIRAANRDPSIWSNPEKFDPERHLDKQGKFVYSKKIIPFSLGIRSCAGELIAKREVALMFVNILQRFTIQPHTNPLPPLDSGISGGFYSSHPYEVVLKERKIVND